MPDPNLRPSGPSQSQPTIPNLPARDQTCPAAPDSSSVLMIGPWRIDRATRSVTDGDRTARFSPRALKMIEALAAADGAALSRSDLMTAIWPNVTVGDESLTQTVTEVRRILCDRPGPDRIIETIPKFGYRICAPVESARVGDQVMPRGSAAGFDLTAYQLCLDARTTLVHGGENAISHPVTLTEEAVSLAPEFAFARAEYAIALSYRWLYQREDPSGLNRAFENAELAIALRPDQATGHVAIAFAHGALGRTERMRRALEQALAQDQSDSELHMLGARALFASREFRGAAALAERATQLNSDDFRAPFFASRAAAHFDELRSRRLAQQCLARLQSRLSTDPADPRALHTLGPVLAALGHNEAAERAIFINQSLGPSPCMFYDSIGFSLIGDFDRAVEVIENVSDLGWRHVAWIDAERAFGSAQGHTRLNRIVRRIRRAKG